MSNLKPCPHCGEDRIIIAGGPNCYYARCQDCSSEGGARDTQADAIAAWNRRASPWRESQKEPPPKDEAWMLGRSKLTGIDLFRWCPVDEEWLDGTDMPSERPDWWMPIPPLEGA